MVVIVDAKDTIVKLAESADYKNRSIVTNDGETIYNTGLLILPIPEDCEIPDDLTSHYEKYCYSQENQFYLNPNYKEDDVDEIQQYLPYLPLFKQIVIANDPALENTDGYDLYQMKDHICNILSKECNEYITNGIDVTLEDAGETKHVSLTSEDQLNLMLIVNSITEDVQYVPYHLDEEDCTYYTVKDFMHIYTSFRMHQLFHTTLINQLHQYIRNDIKSIEELNSILYSTKLPKIRFKHFLSIIYTALKSLNEPEERIQAFIYNEFCYIGEYLEYDEVQCPTEL